MHFIKRLIFLAPLMLLISFAAFVLVRLAPGGPFDRDRTPASPEIERQLQAKYHLDEPVWKQYLRFLSGAARGDLGPSFKHRNHSVQEIIAQGLPVSLTLGALAFLFALCLGLPLGILTAIRQGHWIDAAGSALAVTMACVPALVIGPVLIMAFAIHVPIFPVALWDSPAHAVLPTVTLGLFFAGRIARLMREGMLNVLSSEFMITARAKGLAEHKVLLKHGFPIAVLPVLSYSGPLLADLLTGSFVVENIFQIPGIGVFMVNSSLSRDYPVVLGLVLLYALMLLLLNLLVDLIHAWVDRRVKYE